MRSIRGTPYRRRDRGWVRPDRNAVRLRAGENRTRLSVPLQGSDGRLSSALGGTGDRSRLSGLLRRQARAGFPALALLQRQPACVPRCPGGARHPGRRRRAGAQSPHRGVSQPAHRQAAVPSARGALSQHRDDLGIRRAGRSSGIWAGILSKGSRGRRAAPPLGRYRLLDAALRYRRNRDRLSSQHGDKGSGRRVEVVALGFIVLDSRASDCSAAPVILTFPDSPFRLAQAFPPAGDQPEAIDKLVDGIRDGLSYQTLLGVTGSGKTFTMANVIARLGRPALILAPNKTLAAQLYAEMRESFPENAVEYFVSYYDYYQPEAYVPSRDLYIEKDSAINQEVDRLRHAATAAVFARRDVIVVASVSCIYGLGSPEVYEMNMQILRQGEEIDRDKLLRKLVSIQYTRNDTVLSRGTFRVKGETLEVFPAYAETAFRATMFGDEVERLQHFDPLTGELIADDLEHVAIWPATHYNVREGTIENAVAEIGRELEERCGQLEAEGKLLESHRLEQRTRFDMEMIKEVGYCAGIENYSRYLSGRAPGEPPPCLFDYLPRNALLFVDESHQTIPQH